MQISVSIDRFAAESLSMWGIIEMLLRFGVSNHLSIHGYQELSLVASSLKDPTEGLVDCPAAPTGSVVPAVVVYGANAAGKTNLVRALTSMQGMVQDSQTKGIPGGGVPRHPFLLDGEMTSRSPSQFDIDFVSGGIRYHYGFTVTDEAFESEWLHAIPRSHCRTLFSRKGARFRFGRGLKGQNKAIAKLTRPNSLFLSAAAQNGHEQLLEIFGYFRSIRIVRDIDVQGADAALRLSEMGVDKRVVHFLRGIGTGVDHYRMKEREQLEQHVARRRAFRAPQELSSEIEATTDGREVTIELAHRGSDGRCTYFELDQESAGTRRMLIVLSLVFQAIDDGAPVLVDEVDTSLHTQAAEAVLDLFHSEASNPRGSQLITTTHDTNLLNIEALRRDQIWFTEKDSVGATHLFPLTDIRTRRGDSIEKGYLQGRYGAVPTDIPVSLDG